MRGGTHFATAREIGTRRPPPFGYLLTMDCYDCLPLPLRDISAGYWLLDTLAASLGMQKQAPPFVFASPLQFSDKAGLSGWVPLIESGIQLHTLTAKKFASLDIYCCRKIDRKIAVAVVKDCFAPVEVEINEIERGKFYHG